MRADKFPSCTGPVPGFFYSVFLIQGILSMNSVWLCRTALRAVFSGKRALHCMDFDGSCFGRGEAREMLFPGPAPSGSASRR